MWYNHEHNDHADHATKRPSNTKRRRFLKQGGLAAGAAVVSSFLGITPLSYARTASTSDVTITQLDASQAKSYLQVVFKSSDYHRFQQVAQHNEPGIFTIQELQAEALQVTSKEGAFVIARIPVAGGIGYSYYVAVFKLHTLSILQTQGALFRSAGGHNIDAYVERDGQAVFHGILSPEGKLVGTSNPSVTLSTSITPDDQLSQAICLADCANIPLGVAYIAVIACASLCAISFGIACVICLIGAIGFGGGVIARCLHDCPG